MGIAKYKFEVIRETLACSNNRLSIKELCELSGVSRAGYYKWEADEGKRKQLEDNDKKDYEMILAAYNHRGYKKGYRSIYMRLLQQGIQMNPKKIRRLMEKYGLRCPIRKANPYRKISKALRVDKVTKNLLNREFSDHGARKVLLTDITYIPLQGEFIYLSTIIDAYTRQVLAYQVSDSLEIDFVLETVKMLNKNHGIELSQETLIHSDQGCHYTSRKFIQIVKSSKLRQSMSRRGNCWDNAPQESFFGHMKDELAEKANPGIHLKPPSVI